MCTYSQWCTKNNNYDFQTKDISVLLTTVQDRIDVFRDTLLRLQRTLKRCQRFCRDKHETALSMMHIEQEN
jgi:CBS-domain-containing membrane protein